MVSAIRPMRSGRRDWGMGAGPGCRTEENWPTGIGHAVDHTQPLAGYENLRRNRDATRRWRRAYQCAAFWTGLSGRNQFSSRAQMPPVGDPGLQHVAQRRGHVARGTPAPAETPRPRARDTAMIAGTAVQLDAGEDVDARSGHRANITIAAPPSTGSGTAWMTRRRSGTGRAGPAWRRSIGRRSGWPRR